MQSELVVLRYHCSSHAVPLFWAGDPQRCHACPLHPCCVETPRQCIFLGFFFATSIFKPRVWVSNKHFKRTRWSHTSDFNRTESRAGLSERPVCPLRPPSPLQEAGREKASLPQISTEKRRGGGNRTTNTHNLTNYLSHRSITVEAGFIQRGGVLSVIPRWKPSIFPLPPPGSLVPKMQSVSLRTLGPHIVKWAAWW